MKKPPCYNPSSLSATVPQASIWSTYRDNGNESWKTQDFYLDTTLQTYSIFLILYLLYT